MILNRMKRGAHRAHILFQTKFEKQFSTIRNGQSFTNLIKSIITVSLVTRIVLLPIPTLAASSEVLSNDDSGPVPSLVREVNGVDTLNYFTPEPIKSVSITTESLNQIEVVKSVASIKAEEQEAAQAKLAQEEAEKKLASKKKTGIIPVINSSFIDIQKLANQMVSSVFGQNEWDAMNILIMRESGYNPNAVNQSSGACGLPQALPCSKIADKSVEGQINWMINYVKSRYGTPTNALLFHNLHHWY